jgi:hypothetical protein
MKFRFGIRNRFYLHSTDHLQDHDKDPKHVIIQCNCLKASCKSYAAQAEKTGGFENKNACISCLSSSVNCRKSQDVTVQIHYLTEKYLHMRVLQYATAT